MPEPEVKNDADFGHWETLEERLEELRNRLVAWSLTSPKGFENIWREAKARYDHAVASNTNPYELDGTTVVECFEGALADFDAIWVNTQKVAMELDMVDFEEIDDGYTEED